MTYFFTERQRFYDNTGKVSTRIYVRTVLSEDDLYVTLQKDYPTKDLYIDGTTGNGLTIVVFAGTVPLTKHEKETRQIEKMANSCGI